MKVLIVDDERIVRLSLKRALASRGHEVVEACDGGEGLARWKEQKFDVIFLDVLMPVLSGPQVLVKRGDFDEKVILMSAYSGDYDIDRAREIGADLFMAKPFSDIFSVVQGAEKLVGVDFESYFRKI